MLVLTRLAGEEIVIEPNTIRIEILSLRDGRVRLGIHAPQSVTIMRKELIGRYEELRRQAEEKANGREEA